MKVKNKIGVGIGVILIKDNKVLLGRRHEDPEKASSLLKGAGTWTMPGGKLRFGESFEEGAKREVKEETGMELKTAKVICVNDDRIEDIHFITIGLLSQEFEGEPQAMEPDQITEWSWFDLDKLPNPLYSPSAKILDSYTEENQN